MKNMLSFLSKKNLHNSDNTVEQPDTGAIDSDDDASIIAQMLEHMDIDSLIDDVSDEIDDDYKHDIAPPKPHGPSKPNGFPDFVRSIDLIDDFYSYQSQIGRGVSGGVYLAQSKDSFKQYALKRMLRSDKMNLYSFINEITNLKSLDHPNIVRLNDAYITNKHYFVSTEYCSGGTLHQRIMQMKRFSERDCVDFMHKLLETIHYIHSRNIVHRDLKLSNVVFDSADIQHSKLKIIDFGESELITDPQRRDRNVIGSKHFLPPETNRVRKKHELFAGDMWSIGVIAYTLIEGAFPYKPTHVKSIKKTIDQTPLTWNANIPISDACKDFIQSLLHKDIDKRLNAQQALKHPWITSQATDKNLGDEYFSRLQRLTFGNKLQQVLVQAIIKEMSETDKKHVLSHDGYEDDTQLINTILSEGTSLESFTPANQNDVKPLYKHTAYITDMSLDEMAIDDILAEIDLETSVDESVSDNSYNDEANKLPMIAIKTFQPQSTMLISADSINTLTPISTMTPNMDDTICTEQFIGILRASEKKYDIPQIVRQVTNDNTAPITYRSIASFHQPMDSLDIGSHDYF
eukprot:39770_1